MDIQPSEISAILKTQIANFQSYLAAQTTLLTNEYDAADIALQQLPIEEQQINAELGNPTTSTGN